jgi:uncharacterized protein (DUF2252 family)
MTEPSEDRRRASVIFETVRAHESATGQFEWGRSLRERAPLETHAELGATDSRDPVGLIHSQEASRLQWLVPLRHERMGVSAFAFYRGSAVVQAADLAPTGVAGIEVQLCGDAHLSNFGLYGSPERRLVFDVNDFDETLPGPFEWDVKRLAASVVLAGRDLGYAEGDSKKAARRSAQAYRESVNEFATARYIDAWYASIEAEELQEALHHGEKKPSKGMKRSQKMLDDARSKDCLRALEKLAVEQDGQYRIKSEPPNIVPFSELASDKHPDDRRQLVDEVFREYLESLPDSRATLLYRYRLVDVAVRVVGVGSVGTRCYIALLEGRHREDPLFLQVKEAGPSVLEAYHPPSRYPNAGQRVVEGQRVMQSASDIFLGWTHDSTSGHDYYVRQMWDMKGSADMELLTAKTLRQYAKACGWTLAHAHCRTGSASAISGYLGDDDTFDRAVAEFAVAYADLAEVDYEAFKSA